MSQRPCRYTLAPLALLAVSLGALACQSEPATNDTGDASQALPDLGPSSVADLASVADSAGVADLASVATDSAVPPVEDPCIAAGSCPDGVWIFHALPGFVMGTDTVQTILVDPVRPTDFYAFVGSNNGPTIKVYASTDYGNTWINRNTTAAMTGNPWGATIDPNPSRDPSTPPTMWSPSGYGAFGAWKSIDGGATWVRSAGADTAFDSYNPHGVTDLYHLQILPDDPPNHVLATYHYSFKDNEDDGGFGESWDGGATWVIHPPPVGVGTSHYVIPIGATTWAVIAQDNGGKNGIWRTTTAGRTGGTAGAKFRDGTISTSAWMKVDDIEHVHGSHQNVVAKDGTIYVTGWTNGARSTDGGATFTKFTNGSWAPPLQYQQSTMSNLAITDRYIYTNYMLSPTLARAPLDNPIGAANWDVAYCETPAAMTDGGSPFGSRASYNATAGRWVILAGSSTGIWKYVEAP